MFCPVPELAGRQSVDNTVDAQICVCVCVPLKTCYLYSSKISDLFDAVNDCNDCLGCFIVTI